MSVISGQVTLNSSTPTLVCVMGQNGALVFTTATVNTVVIGGPGVTSSTGVPLPSSQYVAVPGAASRMLPFIGAGVDTAALYAIATTGSGQVLSYLTTNTGSGT